MEIKFDKLLQKVREKDNWGWESISYSGVFSNPSWQIEWNSTQDFINEFFEAINPTVQISATPSFGLREVWDDILNPIIKGTWSLWWNPPWTLTNLEFFRGTTSWTAIWNQLNPTPSTEYSKEDTWFTVITEQTYTVKISDSESRLNTKSWKYEFTLPFFGTSVDITVLTKQTLKRQSSNYFQCDMIAETDTDKQKFDFPDDFGLITGIEFYNTVSWNWEWLNWSKSASLTLFDKTDVIHVVQWELTNYDRYTNNGSKIWARQLRFYKN